MVFAVNMICSEREGRRLKVDIDATLRSGNVHQIDVEIENISVSGFSMSTSIDLQDGELITIGLGGLGMQPAVVVRRTLGQYGCQFINRVPQSYVDRLRFEKPNTITPFVPNATKNQMALELLVKDGQIPPLVRVAVIATLSVSGWILVLALIESLCKLV